MLYNVNFVNHIDKRLCQGVMTLCVLFVSLCNSQLHASDYSSLEIYMTISRVCLNKTTDLSSHKRNIKNWTIKMLVWKYRQLQYSQGPMVNIFDMSSFTVEEVLVSIVSVSTFFTLSYQKSGICQKLLISPMMYFIRMSNTLGNNQCIDVGNILYIFKNGNTTIFQD